MRQTRSEEKSRAEFGKAAKGMHERMHAWRKAHPEASFNEIAEAVNQERKQLMSSLIEEVQTPEARAEMQLDVRRRMLEYDLRERIVPGTDSGVGNLAFGHLDYDLQLLVRVGFSPAEALLSAIHISAEAIGMADKLGTIAPGKVADLVALDGDPTRNIGAVSEVVAVFQAGCAI